MPLPKKTTRWLPVVVSEIARGRYPFAPELILPLIWYESRGVTGNTNQTTGASGLIQVIPKTVDWYNQQTGDHISITVMRSKDPATGALQIRVGLWVLGRFWKSAYRWIRKTRPNVPLSDLVRFADAFYAGGGGKVQGMAKNINRTWADWERKFPNSNITKHANYVWDKTVEQNPTWDLDAVDKWVKSKPDGSTDDSIEKDPKGGLMLGLIAILIASFAMKWLGGTKK